PIGADRTTAVVSAARRSYRALQTLPMIPLLILGVLASMAVLAPVVAPHSKLDPVKPTREQCLAKFNIPDCPYVDNAPPFWAAGGTLDTPLGTDSLGRDVLSRLMHGARISLIVALTGTLFAGAIGTVLGVLAGYMGRWWAVIIEASLSFLGFGVPPPEPSWGLMMAQERESLMEGRWWLEVFPGLCITMLVLSANMLGDWLRVRLDPQLRNR